MRTFPHVAPGLPPLAIDGTTLRIEDVVAVARMRRRVTLAPEVGPRVQKCRAMIDVLLDAGVKVYGLTTGFGKLRDVVIPADKAEELQVNLLRSHASGVGRPFAEDIVRGALLLRANTLCRGNSGVRLHVIEEILRLLNDDVYPYVPEKGSLGASGDLAPLSHLMLVLIGDVGGRYLPRSARPAPVDGFLPIVEVAPAEHFVRMPDALGRDAVWSREGWTFRPVSLAAKEGLALNNGTQFMTAIASLAVYDGHYAVRFAELGMAASLEAQRGVRGAFDKRIHAVRPQREQGAVAARILAYTDGSDILDLHLNSAWIRAARVRLEEALEKLLGLAGRLEREGIRVPATLTEATRSVERLAARVTALVPAPDHADHALIRAWGATPPRQQLTLLHEHVARARQDAASLLTALQAFPFPEGPERDQARSAVVRAIAALDDAVPGAPHIQDDYSFRCTPQVLATAWRALDHVAEIVEVEVNAATDNPLLFPPDPADVGDVPFGEMSVEEYRTWLLASPERMELCTRCVIGGGNFHGEPVAVAMDYFKIAMAEVASLAERRIAHLIDGNHSAGLPFFLMENNGLHSGYMIPQYTAAALVSENKVLCHPASVDSIPSCANTEDHVSMGTIAARKALEVVGNVQSVLAIELVCASQGLRFREPLQPGPRVRRMVELITDPARGNIPRADVDRVFGEDIERMRALMDTAELRGMLLEA